jgi:hypothetical protein
MVLFNEYTKVNFNNKSYAVIKVKYKDNIIPIILDYNYFKLIPEYNWLISETGLIYRKISDNKFQYLHELILKKGSNKITSTPIIHINKLGIDNRLDNLMFDKKDKEVKKNLSKKARTIKLKDKVDVNKIPTYVWYLKKDKSHGERFQVDLGNIKWKCTSSNDLSLKYKLEETKKFLRQMKEDKPSEFEKHSMNNDLNICGEKLKKDFYEIISKAGFKYRYHPTKFTDFLLKEDKSGLTSIEKKLLLDFDIKSEKTTLDRLRYINYY